MLGREVIKVIESKKVIAAFGHICTFSFKMKIDVRYSCNKSILFLQ